MKVTITKESGRWMTVDELPFAKKIVQDMKEDEWSAKEYAEMAADAILQYSKYDKLGIRKDVLTASAEICRDNGIEYEQFGEGCGRLGVWIEATVETYHGFLKFGCLLSDIWGLGTDEARWELLKHSYVRSFTEQD